MELAFKKLDLFFKNPKGTLIIRFYINWKVAGCGGAHS
jgi:hypothetical protein